MKSIIGKIDNKYLQSSLITYIYKNGLSASDIKNFESIVNSLIANHEHHIYEPIGLVTAQSIAEPATQMTLRSVHSSGDSDLLISTGLEKLNEIVDHTKIIKQKIVKLKLKSGTDSVTISKILKLFEIIKGPQLDIKIDIQNCKLVIRNHARIAEIFEILSLKPVIGRYSTMTLINSQIEMTINQDMGYVELSKLYKYLRKTTIIGPSKIDGYTTIHNADGSVQIVLKGTNFKYIEQNLKIYARYIKSIECNNSYEIEKYYGIPYTSANIIMELDKTLNKQQGLDVSYTHLKLVAQAMTFTTHAKQIGRHGIVSDKAAVLSQAAYETALKVMVKAAASSNTDTLKSVFSSIIAGRMPPHIGTGKVLVNYDNQLK